MPYITRLKHGITVNTRDKRISWVVDEMKTNDYVKYVTQQLVTYMDQPKEVKREQRQLKKQERSPIAFQLFGVIPYAIMMLFKKKKSGG